MTTLLDIRTFLDTNQDRLAARVAKDMGADKAHEFTDELAALQKTWQQNLPEDVVLQTTREQIKRYPPVWEELQKAGFTATSPVSTPDQLQKPLSQPQLSVQPSHLQATPSPVGSAPAKHQETSSTSAKPTTSGDATIDQMTLPTTISERMAIWDKKTAIGKELLTGCLGILIVAATLLVALIAIVFAIAKPTAWDMAKDVLLFLNGLVGVVLGYYFGRIPADARTDKAEEKAQAAQTTLDSTKAVVRTILGSAANSTERGGDESVTVQLTPDQRNKLWQLLGP